MRTEELKPVFCDVIPAFKDMEQGLLYISAMHEMANHLCACGCGAQTVMDFGDQGWRITDNNGRISFTPSVGNFKGETPYHAHYYITENKIVWC